MVEALLGTAAIGSLPPARAEGAVCMFCHVPLRDEAGGFIDHVAASQSCRDTYGSWLDHLDLDRGGG